MAFTRAHVPNTPSSGGDDVDVDVDVDVDEAELASRLASCQADSAEYASLLSDLANLKLSKGHVVEAQQLLGKLQMLRSAQLKDEDEAATAAAALLSNVVSNGQPGGDSGGDSDEWEAAVNDSARKLAPAEDYFSRSSTPPPSGATSAAASAVVSTAPSAVGSKQASRHPSRGNSSRPSATASPAKPAAAPWDFDEAVPSRRQGSNFHDEQEHVVEVYGLTTAVRTMDLEMWVDKHCGGYRSKPAVRWVDDCHALIVCSRPAEARELLALDQRDFNLRPWSEASAAARSSSADLAPPRERPKTTTAVARLLMSHHLGMSQLRDKESERQLAESRRQRKVLRAERAEKLESAWGDG